MIASFLAPVTAAVAFALQAFPAAAPTPTPVAPLALEDLAEEEAAALRCAVAFAKVGEWQKAGDPRGKDWPEIAEGGGREFFVRTMAQLMDRRKLDREGVRGIVARQNAVFAAAPDTVPAIMPACLMMKAAAGL